MATLQVGLRDDNAQCVLQGALQANTKGINILAIFDSQVVFEIRYFKLLYQFECKVFNG